MRFSDVVSWRICAVIMSVVLSLQCAAQTTDYTRDEAFMRRFSRAACDIAHRKIRQLTDAGHSRRLATGGHFNDYFLWDTALCVMWARHAVQEFPVEASLDNFYRFADSDGFIGRQYDVQGRPVWNSSYPVSFAPPVLSWAEYELYKTTPSNSNSRLCRVYPALARHHRALKRFQRDDGLYFSDELGCGMDDLKRYPRGIGEETMLSGGVPMCIEAVMPYARKDGRRDRWAWVQKRLAERSWNRQIGWIDTTSQVALDCYMLANIARIVGRHGEADEWMREHAQLKDAVNRLCWNESLGFYCDRMGDGTVPRRHAGGFWVLVSRVATEERAERVVRTLSDVRLFNQRVPFPCLPKDDPEYDPISGYWCGSVWPPTNYAAIKGLLAYGYRDFAEDVARRWYNASAEMWVRFGTVFENLSPERFDMRKEKSDIDFCGWGAIAPIALPVEFGWLVTGR